MESAFPDREHFARLMKLIDETKKVAARVYPKHTGLFPGGLAVMCAVPPDLHHAPIQFKIAHLENNLEFLKELDEYPDTTVQSNTELQVCLQDCAS